MFGPKQVWQGKTVMNLFWSVLNSVFFECICFGLNYDENKFSSFTKGGSKSIVSKYEF
jgi:hypothetical protein